MNDMDARLRRAVSAAVPDVLDSVLSDCGKQKGTVIMMSEKKKHASRMRRIAGLAAAFVILVGGLAGFGVYRSNYAVASTISLDINPSIEIQVNRKEEVLAVNPLNADAEIVVGTMDFRGSSLDVTVNALVGSMLRNGYLSEIENSILISVDSSDPQQGAAMQERLSAEVSELLHTDTFDGAVLSQTVAHDPELQTLAETYGITAGKAQLIRDITAVNPQRAFEELAPLSINELNLLAASKPESVTVSGSASDKAYIGRDAAEQTVLENINAGADQIAWWDTELDFEDGRMVYEVEFALKDAFGEYTAVVDAATGEILYAQSTPEYSPEQPQAEPGAVTAAQPAQTEAEYITAEQAKEIALAHAGVQNASFAKAELDEDDGRMVYEVEFRSGGWEYEYEIDAVSGTVLKSDREFDD